MTPERPGDSHMTTDRDTIMEWAETHDVVPVRTSGEDTPPYDLHAEREHTERMEPLSWDAFFQHVDENDLVVVHHGEGADATFEVIDHDQAGSRAALESSELQDRLVAGETVTSELTETTVIERTVVEHATVESEIVDTELLDSRVVEASLVSRDVGSCDIVDETLLDEGAYARFETTGQQASEGPGDLPQPVAVEVDVEEDWSVTRELLERATVESRIVDVDVSETGAVEAEHVETTIELESVQQSLLESDIVETEADPDEVIQSGSIESEFHGDDVVRSHLNRRRVVEDQVTEHRLLRGELTGSETLQTETEATTPIETAFVEGESLDGEVTPVGATRYRTDAADAEHEERRVALTEEDEGKSVVDTHGEPLGIVEEVRGDTAYIEPEPGIVDRIRAKLGWGEADEDDYPIDESNISRITDDEVVLALGE